MKNKDTDPPPLSKASLAERIDSVGWALFFIWVGISFLLDVGWGVGLLGIGVIPLAEQAARKFFGLSVEGFWIVVGAIFVSAGLATLMEADLPLLPILLIAAGIWVLISAFGGKHLTKKSSSPNETPPDNAG